MKYIKTSLIYFSMLFICFGLSFCWSQTDFGAAAYLQNGIGARAQGMGNAFVAVTSDATAGYWNPAGLTNLGLTPHSLGSMVSIQTLGRSLNYLGYAQQTEDYGSFGVSWISDGWANNASVQNAFIFSYADMMDYVLRYGVSAKLLHQTLGGSRALGMAFDLAVLYQPLLAESFWLGANVQNIAGKIVWDRGSTESIFLNLKFGAASQLMEERLLLAFDVDLLEGQDSLRYHAGAEYRMIEDFWVRGGWFNQQWTVGASYSFSLIYELDYAYLYNRGQGDTHQVSLIVRF